jgi:NTP pyrophosphatase (non-canonical NTP hydrolase)
MEKLDVNLAKDFMFEMIDKTNKVVQAVCAGTAESCLFVAVIHHIVKFGRTFGFCLVLAVQAKQAINEQKYPSLLNQGIVIDYKLVSLETGIHKNSAGDAMCNLVGLHCLEPITEEWMDSILLQSKNFVNKRNWCKYEHPRMLCLAMMEEVGELCGVLKFVNNNDREVNYRLYGEMVSETCDVFIYFCRLSNLCGFFNDIKTAAMLG